MLIGTNSAIYGKDGSPVAVAIGHEARVGDTQKGVEGGVVLGAHSWAAADGAVALGSRSVADRPNTVSVGNKELTRQITNVAAGTEDTDAVNVAQLKRSGLFDKNGTLQDALVYDAGKNRSAITLGGVGAPSAVSLTNVAAGRIGADSTDAVNGGQLYALTGRVENLEKVSPPHDRSPNGDVKPRDIGGRISNVTAGVENKHATNVGQLNTAVADGLHQAQTYTDGKVGALRSEFDQKIDHNRKDALGGTAAAIAIANLPQAYPGESMVSVAGGNFGGQSAGAIGVSTSTQKWAVKASFTADTRGSYGGGLGAGYRF